MSLSMYKEEVAELFGEEKREPDPGAAARAIYMGGAGNPMDRLAARARPAKGKGQAREMLKRRLALRKASGMSIL